MYVHVCVHVCVSRTFVSTSKYQSIVLFLITDNNCYILQ